MIEVFDLYQNEHKTYFINHYLRRGVEQWQLVGLITRRSQVQVLPPLLVSIQDRQASRFR